MSQRKLRETPTSSMYDRS